MIVPDPHPLLYVLLCCVLILGVYSVILGVYNVFATIILLVDWIKEKLKLRKHEIF
jgi:hypothetical protein